MKIWQQRILWGSLLISSPAWSIPNPAWSIPRPASPDVHTYPTSIAVPPAPSTLPAVSAGEPVQQMQLERSRTTSPAGALMPLQSLQREAVASDPAELPSTNEPLVTEPTRSPVAQSSPPPPQDGSNSPPKTIADPELGVLRLQAPQNSSSDPGETTLGQNQLDPNRPRCASGVEPDPELGCLPLQALPPPPPPRQPVVYLLGRLDYFRSSNVFSAVDPVNDGLVRPGLTLFSAPALGPDTYFIGSIDGNLVRYSTQTQINYNELRFRAGIFQRLSPTMFGEIGWSNQQLFIASDKIRGLPAGRRFLNDHAIRLELSRRDQLGKHLALNTFYQLRISFADPDSRSRILNSVIASLSYDLQPNLQIGLDYQFALANFTVDRRDDQYHQLAARLTYTAFRNTQMNVFIGYSFGNSSDPSINFNSLILGVSLTVNLGLF